MIFSYRNRSGVSQQLLIQVKISTLPNSIGAASPLSSFKRGIRDGKICISHIVSLPQYEHFGIGSVNGRIKSGFVSLEYLNKSIEIYCSNYYISIKNKPQNLPRILLDTA